MTRWIDQSRHRHRLLGLALLALQLALMMPRDPAILPAAILVHFGLILLWQPFWQDSVRLNRSTAAATVAVGVAVVWLGSWLVLAAWLLVLLGVVGGEQVASRRERLAQWLVIGYLMIALLVGVAPILFGVAGAPGPSLRPLIAAAGILPVVLMLLPAAPRPAYPQRFDYLRSLSITLLGLMLALGSALWTYRSGTPYPQALVETMLFAGGVILVVNWTWRRRASHTFFQVLWNRYLLNVGTPFEHYLVTLAGPGTDALPPEAFLEHALAEMARLEWVEGVEVEGRVPGRLLGRRTEHPTMAPDDTATLTVYTARDPGPALRLHIQLLARLVQRLFHSRRQEMELRNQEKARAVHETGARLTHDIKNLLQSLQALSAAVGSSGTERSDEALALVQRQLPHINDRLRQTLDKLRDPEAAHDGETITASVWWEALRARYDGRRVRFTDGPEADVELPRDLFDTVAENLLENAHHKPRTDGSGPDIRVRLCTAADRATLEVEDTGEPVPEQTARGLFSGATASAQGLGVGLYQCARLAEFHGFALELAANEPGRVCFRLAGPVAAQSS